MRKSKKVRSIVLMMALCFTMLIGCEAKQTVSAEASMEGFYHLIVFQDTKELCKLGIDSDEAKESLSVYKKSIKTGLKNTFTSANVAVTDGDINKISNAITSALSKLDYKITVKNKDDDTATVTVNSQTIDYKSIFKSAKEETVNGLKSNQIETKKAAKNFLVDNIVKGFQEATPSSQMKAKDFTFTKQKVKSGSDTISMFFPEDTETLGADLMRFVTNQ